MKIGFRVGLFMCRFTKDPFHRMSFDKNIVLLLGLIHSKVSSDLVRSGKESRFYIIVSLNTAV